ncbi:MAG: phospholipase D-like domain-containing protein, partial [Myxococcota bacterium]
MQSTRAPTSGQTSNAASTPSSDAERSKAWASAIDVLPHALHLYSKKFDASHEPKLQRVVQLAGSPITPERWESLDKTARREVVKLLSRTGVAVGDLAPKGQNGAGRKSQKKSAGKAEDGFSRELGLSWARLTDDLPFNLYYNTVNPAYVPAADREQVDALSENIADGSPLDLPQWSSLPPTVKHAVAYRRIRFHLDPNQSAPITRSEWQAMKPEARQEVLALLQDSGFGIAHFQRPKARENHAGRAVHNVAPASSGGGDDRNFELTSSVSSLANLVTPVVSRALTPGANKDVPGTFDFERNRIVDEASKFLVTRYYGFERQDFVDRLIAAARRGVKVEVEMHPPQTATRRSVQQAALDKLKAALEKDSTVRANMSIAESTIVPHDPERDFPQIMHEKSVIADTPDGTLVELEGGINGGDNSPNNLDYAMRIEGSAVHDALRKYLSFRSSDHKGVESVAEQMIREIPRGQLEQKVVDKSKREGMPLTKVTLGGGGRRRVPAPQNYSLEALQQRAEAGLSINLSIHDVARFTHVSNAGNPRWGLNEALGDILNTALKNRSSVTITIPKDDEAIDQSHYLAIKDATAPLRKLGALVCWDDTVIRDVSYKNLVYQNLDLAIERKESCEIAAFALTDGGVMERVVNLHRALQDVPEAERPPVRIAVHELEIEDNQVNQKVVALTTAGVDVRVFTERDAVDIAQKLSKEMNVRISPDEIKLHAKGMLLGREAAGGEPVDPRTSHGSANFSDSGFERNVEGGRFYHQPALVDQITTRVFDEIFASSRPVEKLDIVPLAHRESIFERVPLDTPLEDLSFMAYDLETTGFAAHFGDVPVSMAAIRESLQKTENADGTVSWSRATDRIGELNARNRLGFNAFGSQQKVPKTAADIHGLTHETVKDEPPLQDALEQFQALARKDGKVAVALCHNTKFDAPFLDLQLAKPRHAIEGVNLEAVDAPSVCTMELAKEVLPFKKKEERGPD